MSSALVRSNRPRAVPPGSKRVRTSQASRSSSQRSGNQRLVTSQIYRPLIIRNSPLPLRLQNTLRYVEEVQVGIDGGGFGHYIWSCNGMYDPNITGVGHQPLYFDQMTPLYNHYKVMSSKIRVSAVRTAAAGDVNLALFIDDDAAINATNVWTCSERPGAVTWHGYPSSGLIPSRTLTWDAKKYFGGDITDNINFQGDASNNPAEQSYFVVAIEAQSTVNLFVEIEYTAVWTELKSIATS